MLVLWCSASSVDAAQVFADRVRETTTTTGTGTVNLAGAVSNYRTFVAGIGTANTTYYCIVHRTLAEWECGLGTVTSGSPDTLSRSMLSSSTGSAVSFSAGTKDAFATVVGAWYTTSVTASGTPTANQVCTFSSASVIMGDGGLTFDPSTDVLALTSATDNSAAFTTVDGGTTNVLTPIVVKHTTSGAMADGFGSQIRFQARDTDAVDNSLATIAARRAGADNTGEIALRPFTAGTGADALVAKGTNVTIPGLASAGTQCVQASSAGLLSVTGSACGSGGGSAPVITTFGVGSPADASAASLIVNSLTNRTARFFQTTGDITLNQLTIGIGTVTTAGTQKLCIYSADGATKLVDVTATGAASNVPLATAVSAVALPAGEYYFVLGCATTCNVNVYSSPSEMGAASAGLWSAGTPAGKKIWHGTVTHTSGTCNATLGTITGTNTAQPVARGDN